MSDIAGNMRVWIGCLACYNNGRLVGEWYDAADAADKTIEDVHVDSGSLPNASCEELWVMDHEGFDGWLDGECSPMEAQRIHDVVAAIEDDDFDAGAVRAWADNEGRTLEEWDAPTRQDFEDAFAGEWASEMEYVEELVADTGMLHGVDETLARYFDFEAFRRDIFMSDMYSVKVSWSSSVWVFHHC